MNKHHKYLVGVELSKDLKWNTRLVTSIIAKAKQLDKVLLYFLLPSDLSEGTCIVV